MLMYHEVVPFAHIAGAVERRMNMASIKKAQQQLKEEKSKPEKSKTKLLKEERRKRDAEAKCWTVVPAEQRQYRSKTLTLHEYLDTPLHRKWDINIKALKTGLSVEQIGKSKNKRLAMPCEELTGNARSIFCRSCKVKVRKFQLKTNNVTWGKRRKNGEAGHHKTYGDKPTATVIKLKALGEDVDKRIAQGQALPKHLQEKLAKIETPEQNPAKAAAKPQKKVRTFKQAVKNAAEQIKAGEKSKVKQGPLSKPKRKPKAESKQQDLLPTPPPAVSAGPVGAMPVAP